MPHRLAPTSRNPAYAPSPNGSKPPCSNSVGPTMKMPPLGQRSIKVLFSAADPVDPRVCDAKARSAVSRIGRRTRPRCCPRGSLRRNPRHRAWLRRPPLSPHRSLSRWSWPRLSLPLRSWRRRSFPPPKAPPTKRFVSAWPPHSPAPRRSLAAKCGSASIPLSVLRWFCAKLGTADGSVNLIP